MSIPIYRPYVFLRCKKCDRKTDHVMINATITEKGDVEEIYECQQCGETKKIYELATSNLSPMQHSAAKGLKEPQKQPETYQTKKEPRSEVAEKVEEPQKQEPMEAMIKKAPASQQPKQAEEQQKTIKIKKKKRRWFQAP